jgi:hypothetical protein
MPSRAEVEEFLLHSCPDPTPLAQLHMLIVCVFFQRRISPETIVAYARAWGLGPAKAAELMRGDVEFGFRWPSIEGVLSDCGAAPAHIEVAHDLFHEYPRRDRPVLATAAASSTQHTDEQLLLPSEPAVGDQTPSPTPEPKDDSLVDGGAKEPAKAQKGSKPDPAQARTVAEFIAMMREFRLWAGNPSFRDMEKTSSSYSQASFAGVGKKTTLPRLQLSLAYIEGCGADADDLEAWKQAWRTIAIQTDLDSSGRPHLSRRLRNNPSVEASSSTAGPPRFRRSQRRELMSQGRSH